MSATILRSILAANGYKVPSKLNAAGVRKLWSKAQGSGNSRQRRTARRAMLRTAAQEV